MAKSKKRLRPDQLFVRKCDQCDALMPPARKEKRAEQNLIDHIEVQHRSYVDPLPAEAPGRRLPTQAIRSVVSGGLPGRGKRR